MQAQRRKRKDSAYSPSSPGNSDRLRTTSAAPASRSTRAARSHAASCPAESSASYSACVSPITELPSATPIERTPAHRPSRMSETVSPTFTTLRTSRTPSA